MPLSLTDLHKALPAGGLFADKSWHSSPEPFPLSAKEVEYLRRLGHRLRLFLAACNSLRHRSLTGKLPEWISGYTDRGKPLELLQLADAAPFGRHFPASFVRICF